MGGRLLRAWVERPLLSPVQIRRRLGAVEELVGDNVLRGGAHPLPARDRRHAASCLPRGVRLCQRARPARAGPVLRAAAEPDGAAQGRTQRGPARRCRRWTRSPTSAARIDRAICDEPPFSVREGGILRPGYSEEVDRLRNVRDHGAQTVAELEQRERERTGAKKLKVGYNKVFGYYIDIPNSAGVGRAAGGLYPQADAGVERALFHARAQGPREHAPDGARAHRGAGVYALQRGAPARRGRGRARAGGGGRRGPARRAVLAGGDCGEKPLRLPRGRSLAHARHPRGAPPRRGAGAKG